MIHLSYFRIEEDDEVRCLKILREKLLRESRLNPSRDRVISNDRLLSILRDVRDSARDRSTWDDAIRSANGVNDHSKEHSIDTLAAAVKVMVEEYLWEAENGTAVQGGATPMDPPRVPPPELFSDPLEDQLRTEIDHLRTKLTEAECACSELMETNKKCMREISMLKEDCDRLKQKQEPVVTVDPKITAQLKDTQTKLSSAVEESAKLKTDSAILQKQFESLRSQLSVIESTKIGPEISPDVLPSLSEWKVIHTKLTYLMATKKEESNQLSLIESMMAQIQTLEAQKTDADAEVTRLSKLLISAQLSNKNSKLPTPSAVSIQRQKAAEEFVGSATAPSSIVSSSRKSSKVRRKKKSTPNEYSVNNCVQQ